MNKKQPNYYLSIESKIRCALKEMNPEKVVYYRKALGLFACVSFERFEKSSVYDSWKKLNADEIEEERKMFERFSFLT